MFISNLNNSPYNAEGLKMGHFLFSVAGQKSFIACLKEFSLVESLILDDKIFQNVGPT